MVRMLLNQSNTMWLLLAIQVDQLTDAIVDMHKSWVFIVAPTYVPRNFRVLRMLDSTTVQFGWDPPTPSDELNIRGVLKGYQVIFSLRSGSE